MIELAVYALVTVLTLFFALFLWARGMAEKIAESIDDGFTDRR